MSLEWIQRTSYSNKPSPKTTLSDSNMLAICSDDRSASMSPEDLKEDDFSQSYNDILLSALDVSALSAARDVKSELGDDEPSSSKATTIRGDFSLLSFRVPNILKVDEI